MPTRPPRFCNWPGCPEKVYSGSYCKEHQKKVDKEKYKRRGTAAQRGYDYKWRIYRKRFLAGNPLCVKCLEDGRAVPATDVDHIIPVSGQSDPLFWDMTNHQSLCHSCHSKKTVMDDGGFGNAKR